MELVARDVTARRALEAERNRLALAVEQSSDAVVLTDLVGRVIYVNEAFEHLHGVAAGRRSRAGSRSCGTRPAVARWRSRSASRPCEPRGAEAAT